VTTGDFSAVTEQAGSRATREQIAMISTRYRLAADLAAGRRVLEVACGPGRGLRLLRASARGVVGGDVTWHFLRDAGARSAADIGLVQFDAIALPFADASFDLVILFEALYYLSDARRFVADAHRILAPGGTLLVCTANCEWDGFCGSAFAVRYFRGAELKEMLGQAGFQTEMLAGFPVRGAGLKSAVVAQLRRAAVRLNVVPATLSGREWLKRVFLGRLETLSADIENDGPREPLTAVPNGSPVSGYKVLYAIGRKA
jgi:SAM-dependent methyltransferase